MRIALFTDGIYPYVIGGMQKHSFYLAKYFALNKIEVDLYHTAPDLSKLAILTCFTEEENKFITSIPVQFPLTGKLPGHYIREMYEYSKLLSEKLYERKSVDFIYVQGLCGMYLLEHKQSSTPPVGINFHGLEMFQKTANFKSKLEQYLFKRPVLRSMKNANVVFSLGGKLTEIIKANRIPLNKIIQIPIGLDETWIRTKPLDVNTKRKFVFVGRYERRKGVEELSEVIKQLAEEAEFSFEFIGAIPENKKIISSSVQYHGSISDVQTIKNIHSEADVLVCPSYSEGMPTVILEAMASGLAIIASDVGAVSEQVDESNGILIAPGDKSDLKRAMTYFINQPNTEILLMKQHSINKIKQSFLWESIIAKTIVEIEKVVK